MKDETRVGTIPYLVRIDLNGEPDTFKWYRDENGIWEVEESRSPETTEPERKEQA